MESFKNVAFKTASRIQAKYYAALSRSWDKNVSLTRQHELLISNEEIYNNLHSFSAYQLPKIIQAHRAYFSSNTRGFGEDAFHAMWYLLLKEFRPKKCLEIGIYRGQTISLWALIAKIEGFDCKIHGISPFSPAGDKVSNYLKNLDYYQDVLSHHAYFNLSYPTLHKHLSTDTAAIDIITSNNWDLIYIDGSHDYEVVVSDYRAAKQGLTKNGLLIMDDSSLYMDFNPPIFAFKGHPGPSKVVKDFACKEMKHLCTIGHNNIFRNE